MPIKQPSISWQQLRMPCEKFEWRDKRTGLMTTGFNPPQSAADIHRVPFHIIYVTKSGRLERGNCISLRVDRRAHKRMVKFIDSGEIRWIYDFLVIEVNGIRVITH